MPSRVAEIMRRHQAELLSDWLKEQLAVGGRRELLMKEAELREQSKEFLGALTDAAEKAGVEDPTGPAFEPVLQLLQRFSASRSQQGFTPGETAAFVFSLKRPLFTRLRREVKEADALADELWAVTALLDRLGVYTTEAYQKAREQVIVRQQEDLLELSTPVVELWKGVLALPLIGTLDSGRTQKVMENLLQRIVDTGSEIAIIDITGVPTVDTLTAQHLIKTVTATRLMGADCIISGIRPQIAQTIVHLGVNLGDVITKASLASAFATALTRMGMTVARAGPPRAATAAPRAPARATGE